MAIPNYALIGINCRFSHSCLALFYVRNELERQLPDCQANIFQYTINDPYYDTLKRIAQTSSAGLFFSVYIWNSAFVERLIHDLVLILPAIPIVLGGPQASILQNLPEQCTVFEGEIEGADKTFFSDLRQGALLPVYKGASGASFHSPYRFSDYKRYLENRNIYFESSRGCPFFCSYCLSSVSRGVFHKDVREVKQELGQILKWQPQLIKFVYRTFNDNPERALKIWQFLVDYTKNADNKRVTRFHFEIAPDRFTDDMFGFLEKVKENLFQFEIGIQSTNPHTLAAVNRQMDVAAAAENIKKLISFDSIHVHADLILGLPFENKNSFQNSFNTVFSLQPHYMQMGLLKVLPKTEIRQKAGEYGIVYCQQPGYEVLQTSWLDHQSLADLHDFGECVESFYNNRYFRSLWAYIFQKNENPFSFFYQLLEVCRENDFFVLSATQKLMNEMLMKIAEKRSDKELLHELLRFDWLRCGHRFLPESLAQESLAVTRATLRKKMEQSRKGLFTYKTRNDFLKHSIFLKMTDTAIETVGLSGSQAEGYVCFLSEQTSGVYKHSQAVFIEI